MSSKIEDNDEKPKYLEDTPVEKTLCVIWDLTGLEEYANIFMNECQIHRIMLKIITLTSRERTQELSLGVLANLACFPDKAMILFSDKDLLNVIKIILKDENNDDVRVLFEASNSEQELILSEFLFNNNLIPRFNYFLKNTLNDDLFFISLEILKLLPCIGIPENYFELMTLNIVESFNSICERINTIKDIDRKLFIAIITLINTLLETGLIPQDTLESNHESLYRLQNLGYFDEEDNDEIFDLIEVFNNKIELSKEKNRIVL
ncbi:5664_t:CDS:2 [Rhizophagus irregularis]|nr:5664_t:CDS:2 [Rhizophagus irregularis]